MRRAHKSLVAGSLVAACVCAASSAPAASGTSVRRPAAQIVPRTTKTVPARAVISSRGLRGRGSLVLRAGVVGVASLQKGDVLALGVTRATPGGFLGRVESIARGHSRVVVRTGPASLIDAFPRGQIDVQRALSRVTLLINRSIDCGGRPVSVTGSISTSARVSLAARWNDSHAHSAMITARVGGTFDQTSGLRIRAAAGPRCSTSVPLGSATRLRAIQLTIGRIPIVILPSLQFSLLADGSIATGMNTSVGHTIRAAKMGISYARGTFATQHGLANPDVSFSFEAPSPSQGAISFRTALRAALTLAIDQLPGPTVTLDSDVAFASDPALVSKPWWTLDAGIDAHGTLGFSAWHVGRRSGQLPLLSYTKNLAQAQSSPPAPPKPPPTAVSPWKFSDLGTYVQGLVPSLDASTIPGHVPSGVPFQFGPIGTFNAVSGRFTPISTSDPQSPDASSFILSADGKHVLAIGADNALYWGPTGVAPLARVVPALGLGVPGVIYPTAGGWSVVARLEDVQHHGSWYLVDLRTGQPSLLLDEATALSPSEQVKWVSMPPNGTTGIAAITNWQDPSAPPRLLFVYANGDPPTSSALPAGFTFSPPSIGYPFPPSDTPGWSAGGTRAALTLHAPSYRYRLAVVDISLRTVTVVSPPTIDAQSAEADPFSPDGKTVVFFAGTAGDVRGPGRELLWRAAADGSSAAAQYPVTGHETGGGGATVHTREGLAVVTSDQAAIYAADWNGHWLRRIVTASGGHIRARLFSRAGGLIFDVLASAGNTSFWSVQLDGSGAAFVGPPSGFPTLEPTTDYTYAVSSDGRRISGMALGNGGRDVAFTATRTP